jgi:hypothetical protein
MSLNAFNLVILALTIELELTVNPTLFFFLNWQILLRLPTFQGEKRSEGENQKIQAPIGQGNKLPKDRKQR